MLFARLTARSSFDAANGKLAAKTELLSNLKLEIPLICILQMLVSGVYIKVIFPVIDVYELNVGSLEQK